MDDEKRRSIVNAELYSGEQVLWVGAPSPRRILWNNRTFVKFAGFIIISFFLLILPPFWLDILLPSSLHLHVSLWSVLFVFIVVASLGYLALAYWRAKNIVYAVTSRRALIIEQTVGEKVVLAYSVFRYIEKHESANGSGDLIFATETSTYRSRGHESMEVHRVGFFGIPHVREVEALLRNTFIGKGGGKSL